MKTIFDHIVIDGGQNIGETSKAIMKIADTARHRDASQPSLPYKYKEAQRCFYEVGYPADDGYSIVANRVNKKSAIFQSRMPNEHKEENQPGPFRTIYQIP